MTERTQRIDVDSMRKHEIALNGLARVDEPYLFYYDETNNHRRLHITEDGLNVPNPACFVLGGIVYKGASTPPLDLTDLRKSVKLQANAPELKSKHLGKGDFLELLGKPNVRVFLDWAVSQPELYIHYLALDPLYWATVDIIDSILANAKLHKLYEIHRELKNDLFTVLSTDIGDMASLFYRFSYPNIEERRAEFLSEVRDRLEARQEALPPFNYQMLKGVVQFGSNANSLPFLEGETPNTLIDSLVTFFISRICLFKNARHIFDVEETIMERLNGFTFYDGSKKLEHFRFADSKSEVGVQISDALVGLLGKMMTYACRADLLEIREDMRGLTEGQRHGIAQLKVLIGRSDAECPAFFHHVISNRAIAAGSMILEG